MDEEVEKLSKTLLNPTRDSEGSRAEAAVLLASHLVNIKAFNALFSICSFPDRYAIEDGLLPIAGESIGKIISERDLNKDPLKHHKLDPEYFNSFHFDALYSALAELTEGQQEEVYKYTLENPYCSVALSVYYYRVSSERAIAFQGVDNAIAVRNARNAINLFKRFKKGERDLYLHFKDIIMNIIAGEANVTILPLFFKLIRNYQQFNRPESESEKYSHFHIILITKLVCAEYKNIQSLFSRIREWIVNNLPEDERYIQALELIVRGDIQEAYKEVEEIRKKQTEKGRGGELQEFYHLWYLAVSWLIKVRLF